MVWKHMICRELSISKKCIKPADKKMLIANCAPAKVLKPVVTIACDSTKVLLHVSFFIWVAKFIEISLKNSFSSVKHDFLSLV